MSNITKLIISLLITTGLYSCTGSSNNELAEVAPKLMWIDATANIERFNNKTPSTIILKK